MLILLSRHTNNFILIYRNSFSSRFLDTELFSIKTACHMLDALLKVTETTLQEKILAFYVSPNIFVFVKL